MNRDQEFGAARMGPKASAFLLNGHFAPSNGDGGGGTECDDHPGLYGFEFRLQPRFAGGDVRGPRRFVEPPLAALLEVKVLHRVGDVDACTVDPRFFESDIPKLAGRSNERAPCAVFRVTRLFAHEYDGSMSLPLAEYHLRGMRKQFAGFAVLRGFAQDRKGYGIGNGGRRVGG